MNPDVIAALAQPIAALCSFGAVTVIALMCFPSIRGAIVERMRQRTLRHADATDIVAQLATLRGEVYALREELAQTTRLLGSPNARPEGSSLPAGRQDRLPRET